MASAMVWNMEALDSGPPSRDSLARNRRRLKNSAFWADEVPPRTMDQLRRM